MADAAADIFSGRAKTNKNKSGFAEMQSQFFLGKYFLPCCLNVAVKWKKQGRINTKLDHRTSILKAYCCGLHCSTLNLKQTKRKGIITFKQFSVSLKIFRSSTNQGSFSIKSNVPSEKSNNSKATFPLSLKDAIWQLCNRDQSKLTVMWWRAMLSGTFLPNSFGWLHQLTLI